MKDLTNPFREKMMRSQWEAAVLGYSTQHRNFFHASGARCQGNSFANAFWAGFDGMTTGRGNYDRASRRTIAYAYYRAGQDVRRAVDEHVKTSPYAKRVQQLEGEGLTTSDAQAAAEAEGLCE